MPTIDISKDEILIIANALNAEASSFDELLVRLTKALPSTRDIWTRKAASNRALTVKLLEAL